MHRNSGGIKNKNRANIYPFIGITRQTRDQFFYPFTNKHQIVCAIQISATKSKSPSNIIRKKFFLFLILFLQKSPRYGHENLCVQNASWMGNLWKIK